MQKYGHLFLLLFVIVLLHLASPIFGQSHDITHDADHEFKKFRIAVNLGHAYIPGASFGIDFLMHNPGLIRNGVLPRK